MAVGFRHKEPTAPRGIASGIFPERFAVLKGHDFSRKGNAGSPNYIPSGVIDPANEHCQE
jgi:hypothetical protein